MSRSRRYLTFLLVLLFAAPPAAGDDVASYLARHGLKQLLALHYEEQLEQASPQEREGLAIKLAELYADLLESVDDTALRVDLERRSRELMSLVPEQNSDELRLALLRGGYGAAERIAENHRLRMSSPEEVQRAIDILSDALPQFHALRTSLREKLTVAERRLSRAAGTDASRLSENVEDLRRLYNRSLFLTAWAQYYHAWLTGRPEGARQASSFFAELLEPDVPNPRPDQIALDLLELESMARSVLGRALAESLTSSVQSSLEWLELLTNEQVVQSLRDQVPSWRLAIMLDGGEYLRARQQLTLMSEAGGGEGAPLAAVRLAAVYGLERSSGSQAAAELARDSIAELAGRGELQQVLDLAERYGVEAMGDRGFVLLYVRGAQLYQQARDLHGDQAPTGRSDVVALYEEAAARFTEATKQSDAEKFPAAAANAQLLIGWCSYFQGRYLSAKVAFQAAASILPPREAPEALWMAIVSLDQIVKVDPTINPNLVKELDDMIGTFLARYPASEYAPRLVLRRGEGLGEPSMEVVRQLLDVPPGSEMYEMSQQRAGQMLYELYHDARGSERVDIATRYLSVALPLLARTGPDQIEWNDAAATAFVVRARRILEVSLSTGVERISAATEAFARLEEAVAASQIELTDVQDELDFRRLQILLGSDDVQEAGAIADRIWERDPSSHWAVASVRLLFRRAVQAWRFDEPSGAPSDDRAILGNVVKYGGRTLQEFIGREGALDDPAVTTAFATVADAAKQIWERSGDVEEGQRAHLLYEELVESHPNNATFLRGFALLAPTFGSTEKAMDAWRKISSGSEVGSEGWLEARYRFIRLMMESDPERARQVFDQHRALYPEFGPEPWKSRFIELDADIDVALAQQDIDGGGD